jgi:HK97 family phage prohead protease
MAPLGLNDLLAELRTAETPVISTVHSPIGSPAGPGLWHHKGLQLPAYIQNVAKAFLRKGVPESEAIARAVGVVKDWAAGRAPNGGHVHPDVQAAAAKAVAEWEALKAASGGGKPSGRSAGMAHVEQRAPMPTADQNDLPDSAFAYIEPGGTRDSSGRTTPRNLRHFPIHDKAHADNAAARIAQGAKFGKEALPKVKAAQAKFGEDTGSDSGSRLLKDADVERRYVPGPAEIRAAAEGQKIGGYGAVFGKLSRNLGGFVELVGDTAFNQARMLNWPNVVCRYNHDPNMVLGTTSGHTLSLRTDRIGLEYEVLPPQSRQDILELVERGDVQFSSFAFRVPPGGDEWRTTDQNYPLRVLHEVQLVDVAPVLDPAYTDATAGLRSLAAAKSVPLDEVRQMAEADELRRFFMRSDRPRPPAPSGPKVRATVAMMQLMDKRRDPFIEQG